MPIFLTRHDVYRMLQRELPENVYADGEPSGFFSTADMDSIAQVVETAYTNASAIYNNFWPQDADEKIADQEVKYFGVPSDSSLSLEERRARLLTRIRNPRGITKDDMIATVLEVIGSDKLVEIIEWGCYSGGWMIGESELGIQTYLNGFRMVDATGPGLCEANPADYGFTEEEWLGMREQAYTYEVLIYNYALTPELYAQVDQALLRAEPARSQHVITDGLNPADMQGGTT